MANSSLLVNVDVATGVMFCTVTACMIFDIHSCSPGTDMGHLLELPQSYWE